MQFIERNSYSVRSAVWDLVLPNSSLVFRLIPMVHVAEPTFYSEVSERVADCDVAVLEGVASNRATILTLSYVVLGKLGHLGLEEQDDAKILSRFRGTIIHGDVSGEEFDNSWASLPLRTRILVTVASPVVALQRLLQTSRSALAPKSVEDLPSRDDINKTDDLDALDEVLVDGRDTKLRSVIDKCISEYRDKDARIAVLFGAAHVPAVSRFLLAQGFRVQASEWITVMELS